MDKDTELTWQDAARLGADDIVLPPYTAVSAKGAALRCWGREYRLGKGAALVEQIVTKSVDLLRSPLTVHGRIEGVDIEWHGTRPAEIAAKSPTRAIGRKTLVARCAGKDRATLKITETLEQDGLLIFDLELTPAKGASLGIEKLSLETALPLEHSSLLTYHRYSRVPDEKREYSGLTFAAGGAERSFAFVPFFTIAGDEAGLSWLCDRPRHWGWTKDNSERVFRLARRADTTRMTINLIDKAGLKVGKPLEYRFAFMALPVRPLAKDARSWRLHIVSDNPYMAGWRGIRQKANLCDYRNWTWCIGDTCVPSDWTRMRESVATAARAGIIATPHFAYSHQSCLLPEAIRYMDRWKKAGGRISYMVSRGATLSVERQDITPIPMAKYYGGPYELPRAQTGWGTNCGNCRRTRECARSCSTCPKSIRRGSPTLNPSRALATWARKGPSTPRGRSSRTGNS